MVDLEKVKKIVLEAIALVGVNGLAFYFDAEYIPMAIAVDCLVLGVEIKGVLTPPK